MAVKLIYCRMFLYFKLIFGKVEIFASQCIYSYSFRWYYWLPSIVSFGLSGLLANQTVCKWCNTPPANRRFYNNSSMSFRIALNTTPRDRCLVQCCELSTVELLDQQGGKFFEISRNNRYLPVQLTTTLDSWRIVILPIVIDDRQYCSGKSFPFCRPSTFHEYPGAESSHSLWVVLQYPFPHFSHQASYSKCDTFFTLICFVSLWISSCSTRSD